MRKFTFSEGKYRKLLKVSKDIGLEINFKMAKYVITSRHQNVVQNRNIVIESLSFQNLEKLKYLGSTVANTNDIREQIKCRINVGNACYYSLQTIFITPPAFQEIES